MIRTALLLLSMSAAAPAVAQTSPSSPAPAAGATATATAATTAQPNVAAGAAVVDTSGAAVGTIEAVTNGVATLSTGASKVGVPVTSFAGGPKGLVLGMTKAQVDAQASQATAAASAPIDFKVGAAVNDQTGAKVGTVKAVSGDLVTVASATASAQLPKKSFARSGDALVIGMTPADFEAAAKAAGGAKTAG